MPTKATAAMAAEAALALVAVVAVIPIRRRPTAEGDPRKHTNTIARPFSRGLAAFRAPWLRCGVVSWLANTGAGGAWKSGGEFSL